MLQKARRREVTIQDSLDHLRALGNNSYYFNNKVEEGIVLAIGQLTTSLWEIEREIEGWLKEIDNG